MTAEGDLSAVPPTNDRRMRAVRPHEQRDRDARIRREGRSARRSSNAVSLVIASVNAGERIVLTSNGRPIADVVPHVERSRWVPGDLVLQALADGAAADRQLRHELDAVLGGSTDDIA